jgi:hypothetical protein
MKEHYTWPELDETVTYTNFTGVVTSRNAGQMEMTIRNSSGVVIRVKLEDFIVDQIRNPV